LATDRRTDGPEWRTDGRCDAVAFGVEVVADLHRVARLALVVVLVHRRFQQERVLALGLTHLLDAVVDSRHQHARQVAHKVPHLLVHFHLRVLSPHSQYIYSDIRYMYV